MHSQVSEFSLESVISANRVILDSKFHSTELHSPDSCIPKISHAQFIQHLMGSLGKYIMTIATGQNSHESRFIITMWSS